MRPSLIPGLALAAQKNADRGFPDIALFEVGQIFLGDKPEEQLMAGASLRKGAAKVSGTGRHWSGSAGAVDVFDAKADALEALQACGASIDKLQIVPGGPLICIPGDRARSARAEKYSRAFWRAASRGTGSARRRRTGRGFRVFLDRIPEPKAKATRAKSALTLSPFQPVARDFAFIVDRAVASPISCARRKARTKR